MADSDLQEHWRRVADLLDRAYHLVSSNEGIKAREGLFREYLDHNELGLAWEELVDGTIESPEGVPDLFWRAVVRAGDLMQLTSETDAIRPLAAALTAKQLLYELLYFGLIEIRAYTVEPNTDQIRMLANLFHNLPRRLRDASTSQDYSAILAEMWSRADPNAAAWMRHQIGENLFLDPADYDAPE